MHEKTTEILLTQKQSQAMRNFVRQCRIAALVSWLGAFVLGLALLTLESRSGPDNSRGWSLRLFAIWWLYPTFVLLVMYLKSGLRWHLLHAHAAWHAVLLVTAVINTLFVLGLTDIPWPASLLAGALVVLLVILLEVRTKHRADLERVQYGEHWHRLERVSFVHILLLRMPRQNPGAA